MRAFSRDVATLPSAHAQMMIALDFALGPSSEVVIVGDPEGEDTARMLEALQRRFIPRKVVLFRSSRKGEDDITNVAKFTEDLVSKDGKATAYVCQNRTCNLPTTDSDVMLEQLDERKRKS